MARPVRARRPPTTRMLFRITIHRPGQASFLGRPLKRRSGLRVRRRGRRYGKSVRFSSSRRPLPPFFLFMERHRRSVHRRHPNWTAVQAAKRLGRMWNRLPEEDKEVYREQAERMKGRRMTYRSRVPRVSSRRKAMQNLLISFTTKAASLRNFLMSYL